MRVPGLAWWPGKIPAGTVQREIATTMDLYTTCAKLAGATVPADRTIDGLDISPLLFGTGKVTREAFLYYRGATLYAARLGHWKAHFVTRSGYGGEPAVKHDVPQLHHLGEDVGERIDRARENPDVIAKINDAVARHRAELKMAPSQLIETVARAN